MLEGVDGNSSDRRITESVEEVENEEEITVEEVRRRQIKRLKKMKASGEDGIENEA